MLKSTSHLARKGCFSFFVIIQALWAGPKIAMDTLEAFFGTINEGSKESVSHTFTLRNVGDDVLKIIRIRPTCACESYVADSFIAPGKSGTIRCKLDLKDAKGGHFQKKFTVNTNDATCPRFNLYLSGNFIQAIEFEPQSVVLPTMKNKADSEIVFLETKKSDLQIREAFFQPDNPAFEWEKRMPVKFTFEKSTRKPTKGLCGYTLKLWYIPVKKESVYGRFRMMTNHPDKPELDITGVLDPVQ